MPKQRVMLLLDPGAGGFGDFTNLLRLGKFLVSKNYEVYYTLVYQVDYYRIGRYEQMLTVLREEREIPGVMYYQGSLSNQNFPTEFDFDTARKMSREGRLAYIFNRINLNAFGITWKVLSALGEIHDNIMDDLEVVKRRIEELKLLIQTEPRLPSKEVNYELAVFGAYSSLSDTTRILIAQYSDKINVKKGLWQAHPSRVGFDFVIMPVPPANSEFVLQAGFHSHPNYTMLPRKQVIEILIKNRILSPLAEHLHHSSWGAYYSGTLGTNGLFFKRMVATLPRMLRKHGKITYFTFQDEKHFQKYVLPYIKGKPVGIIDSVSEQVIQAPSDKEVVFINLRVGNHLMEAIVNCCSLCSVSAGDSSFNMFANHLNHDATFTFLKYFNFDQSTFFQYLVNKVHAYETKHGLNHDVSRCIFVFGYYEKIFRHHLKRRELGGIIDIFKLFQVESDTGMHPLRKRSLVKADYALIERLFYDETMTRQFNMVLRAIPAFVKQEDGLESVEDVLLSVLEGKVQSKGRTQFIDPL